MPLVLDDTQPVARIRHQCMDCGRTIEPGERYHRQRGIQDGPYTWKACGQCAEVSRRLWAAAYPDVDDGLYLPDVDWQDVIRWSDEWALLARGFLRGWRNDDGSLIEIAEATP